LWQASQRFNQLFRELGTGSRRKTNLGEFRIQEGSDIGHWSALL
jgi:hypothetical protein